MMATRGETRAYNQGVDDCMDKISAEFLDLLKKITDNEEYLTKEQVIEAMKEVCAEFIKVRQ